VINWIWTPTRHIIIKQVLEYGKLNDWQQIKNYYGIKTIALISMRFRSLEKKALSFISALYGIPIQNFRCFTYQQSIPPHWSLLNQIQAIDEFSQLRLVGGTALALQLGHRRSIDLDFFGDINFEDLDFVRIFKGFKSIERIQKSRNINIFEINEVKVDFVNYT
jgi:hypothetical protein